MPVEDMSVCPQVVLLDLNLPKLGGLDMLKAIRAEERTAPAVGRRLDILEGR